MRLTAVIMAAGSSSRMGSNKLLMSVNDKPMIASLIQSIPCELFDRVVLVYSDQQVADACGAGWLTKVQVPAGCEKDVTIIHGARACGECDGMMFFVADQPFLREDTIRRLADVFRCDVSRIVIPRCTDRQRNPVIFPQSTHKALMQVTGDRGGRDVIDMYPKLCSYVDFDAESDFIDIDTREEYERYI